VTWARSWPATARTTGSSSRTRPGRARSS
jgi:hypothetical protein